LAALTVHLLGQHGYEILLALVLENRVVLVRKIDRFAELDAEVRRN
jgi:hypothetical protein